MVWCGVCIVCALAALCSLPHLIRLDWLISSFSLLPLSFWNICTTVQSFIHLYFCFSSLFYESLYNSFTAHTVQHILSKSIFCWCLSYRKLFNLKTFSLSHLLMIRGKGWGWFGLRGRDENEFWRVSTINKANICHPFHRQFHVLQTLIPFFLYIFNLVGEGGAVKVVRRWFWRW